MENVQIKDLDIKNNIPYELLALADPSIEMIDGYIYRGISRGAYLKDKLVGVCVIAEKCKGVYEIMNVAVYEEHQGRGIGKKLVLDSIDTARKTGAKFIEIGTGNSSLSQLALYQKCGFRIIGVDRDFFIRNYEEEIFENGIRCVDMIRLSLDMD